MAKRLKAFLMAVKVLREQNRAEQTARLNRFKAMTPEQFVRVSREELHLLTDKQYAEIVQHIAPGRQLPEPQHEPDNTWIKLPSIAIPTVARAVSSGLLTGFVVLAASLVVCPITDWWTYRMRPDRSLEASTWPPCRRLNSWVDGCTYIPSHDIDWDRAASLLQIPEDELRQTNLHISQAYIPSKWTLVVWRHRGQLERSSQ